jgi:hypothetical protein
MMRIRVRDPGWNSSDPESGINIPDPHYCFWSGIKTRSHNPIA